MNKSEHLIPKTKVKVSVTYTSGEEEWAYLYLVNGERLQDVVNDERPFLPLLILKRVTRNQVVPDDNYKLILVNKQSIFRLEEI